MLQEFFALLPVWAVYFQYKFAEMNIKNVMELVNVTHFKLISCTQNADPVICFVLINLERSS